MENRASSNKEVRNAFLKMSLKKAPVSEEKQETSINTLEGVVQKAIDVNQRIKRDKWQG